MKRTSLRLLLVEHDEADALLVMRALSEVASYDCDVVRVRRVGEAQEHLREYDVDLVLSDLKLPDSDGLETLNRLQEANPTVPIVALTAQEGDDLDLGVIAAGGQDYLAKGELSAKTLGRALRYAIERKRIELELVRAKMAAESANEVKSEFLATMSHEIRTPLNGLLGFTRLLGGTMLSEKQKEFVLMITSSGRGLMALVNDILDFSRVESGKMQLEEIAFVLQDEIDEVIESLSVRAREKGLELSAEVEREVPALLRGDPRRLRQVVLNLVNNAIKFTTEGRVELKVGLDDAVGSAGECVVRFEVCDTGIGIAPDQQGQLFDPFTQADASVSRQYGGSGLGLAICSRLVGLMGGRIWVVSELGVGSTFTFGVPLRVCESALEAMGRGKPLMGEETTRIAALRVLVAEDNAVNQRLIRCQLEELGCRVDVVGNGEDAVMSVGTGKYDVVLMDLRMPDVDGYEATLRIREQEGKRGGDGRVPVIALTADVVTGTREKCLDTGMDDFLAKPVEMEVLREKLLLWGVDELVVGEAVG